MAKHGENIYRRKDGRYEGRYVIGKNENGKTKFGYVYGRHYQSVRDELLLRKSEQINKRNAVVLKRLSLEECMNSWFEEEILGSVKMSSYQTYLSTYVKHIHPRLGNLVISDITAVCVQKFIEELVDLCG